MWLKDDCIPANSVCPFRVICEIADAGLCHHEGLAHPCDFSCAAARGFAMTRKYPAAKTVTYTDSYLYKGE